MKPTDALLQWVVWPSIRRGVTGRMRSHEHPEQGRIGRAEARDFMRDAWSAYRRAEPDLVHQPTVGSRLMVRMACATLMVFRELVAHGVDRTTALVIVADASWSVFGPTQRLSSALDRSSAGDGDARIRAGARADLGFPFNPPGYRSEPRGDAGYDMVHCPVAEYFSAQGETDVCVAAFCGQDFAAAEVRGLHLDRAGTLVEGKPACDFRYSVAGASAKRREMS